MSETTPIGLLMIRDAFIIVILIVAIVIMRLTIEW